MSRRFLLAVGVVVVLLAGVGALASASDTATRPDLARFALRQSDLPGSRVIRQGYVKDLDYVATYEREFDGGRFQGLRLSNTESDLSLARTLTDAKVEMSVMRTMLTSAGGSQIFVNAMKEGTASEGGKVVGVRTLRSRPLRLGDGGAELAMRVKVTGPEFGGLVVPMEFSITMFRVDRVLAALYILSDTGSPLPPGDVTQLAKVFAARISAGLGGGV